MSRWVTSAIALTWPHIFKGRSDVCLLLHGIPWSAKSMFVFNRRNFTPLDFGHELIVYFKQVLVQLGIQL